MLAVQAGIIPHTCFFFSKKKPVSEGRLVEQMRICGACGHSYEELDARIIRTIDEYTKAGGKYHLPTRDVKKREIKKSLHIFRRTSWETLAWRSLVLTVYITVRSFFHKSF
jgi:hypothetical protein